MPSESQRHSWQHREGPAHLDFAGLIKVLQKGEVGRRSYSTWYSQDIDMGETEVRGAKGGAEVTDGVPTTLKERAQGNT